MENYEMRIYFRFNKNDSGFEIDFGDSRLVFSRADTEKEIAERIGWEIIEYINNKM